MLIYLCAIEGQDEKQKFEIIYEEYKNLMFYVANRILEDTQDSEDIVHQAFSIKLKKSSVPKREAWSLL